MFTDELLVEKLISDFHFVNYSDKDNGSLRLRFKINNDDNFEDLRFRIAHWIDFLLESGFVMMLVLIYMRGKLRDMVEITL